MDRPKIPIYERSSKNNKQIRNQNRVPLAVTRSDSHSDSFEADRSILISAFRTAGHNAVVELVDSAGKSTLVIAREVQRHPITHKMINISFQEVSAKQKLVVQVPVILNGEPHAVHEKEGTLQKGIEFVDVEADPDNIPDTLEIDVSSMKLGQSLHISDLPENPKYRILSNPEIVIATVSSPKAHKAEDIEASDTTENAEVSE